MESAESKRLFIDELVLRLKIFTKNEIPMHLEVGDLASWISQLGTEPYHLLRWNMQKSDCRSMAERLKEE